MASSITSAKKAGSGREKAEFRWRTGHRFFSSHVSGIPGSRCVARSPARANPSVRQPLNPIWREVFCSTWRCLMLVRSSKPVWPKNANPCSHDIYWQGVAWQRRLPLILCYEKRVLDGLCSYFRPPAALDTQTIDDLLYCIGGEKHLDWLIGNLVIILPIRRNMAIGLAWTQIRRSILRRHAAGAAAYHAGGWRDYGPLHCWLC